MHRFGGLSKNPHVTDCSQISESLREDNSQGGLSEKRAASVTSVTDTAPGETPNVGTTANAAHHGSNGHGHVPPAIELPRLHIKQAERERDERSATAARDYLACGNFVWAKSKARSIQDDTLRALVWHEIVNTEGA